jgi:hypothetical protein
MEPLEISLKLAEITLQTKKADLYGDLVKIGIPSFIALVGAVSSFILALKNYKKDLIIAKLNIDNESNKNKGKLKSDLIKEISIGISKLHSLVIKYSSLFASKLDLSDDNLPFPAMNDLSKLHNELILALHEFYETETNILLLGNNNIIAAFRDFHTSITYLCSEYNPIDSGNYNKFNQDTININIKKEALFKELSAHYLNEGGS